MATDNTASLPDYHIWGVGGKLKYNLTFRQKWRFSTAYYGGLRLLGNGHLHDTLGRTSRYERGLVDVVHPARSWIHLLGEAYLSYQGKQLLAKLGRMTIETPIINPQDSRLIPTLVQGIWLEYVLHHKFLIKTGFLNRIAPRSTPQYYSVGRSIGSISLGKTLTGERSDYRNNVQTAGVGILGLQAQPFPSLSIHVWDFYVENVFNSFHTEVVATFRKEKWQYLWKAQHIFQTKVGNGGHEEPMKTYFSNEKPVHVFSSSLGAGYKETWLTLNFARIGDGGRFLYPREWGVDNIYTRLTRERNEGSSDTYEFSMRLESKIMQGWATGLRGYAAYGYYDRPDIFMARKNKYEIPSYQQLVFVLQYSFMSSLEVELLYTRKMNLQDKMAEIDKLNKVDMNHWGVTLEYVF